jgi:IS1 family transposase
MLGGKPGREPKPANRQNQPEHLNSTRFAPAKGERIMANVLSADERLSVIHHLVEGCSLGSITRLTGIHRTTIMNLMVEFGALCRDFLDSQMRSLNLRHVQCDEIWTFVQKKQGRLHADEKDNPVIGDMYLWVAFDQETKLIPTFAIGKRSGDMARRFMVDLARRINLPRGTDTGTIPGIIPQLSTDGFAAYPEAVDLAFGRYVNYGVLIKDYRNTDQPGRYGPPELIATERREIFGIVNEQSICTSHVERHNLTIRTFMRRFTRLSLGFSKKLENLAAACSMYVAYYNYCWRTRESDRSGKAGRLRPTAAMMAGVTDELWSIGDLYERVMG